MEQTDHNKLSPRSGPLSDTEVNRFVLLLDWCRCRGLCWVCISAVKHSNTQQAKMHSKHTMLRYNVLLLSVLNMSTHCSSRKYIWTNNPLQYRESNSMMSPSTCEQSNWREPCERVARQRAELYFFFVCESSKINPLRSWFTSCVCYDKAPGRWDKFDFSPLYSSRPTIQCQLLPDSNVNHTNATKHLELIAVSPTCKTSSVVF